MLLLSYVGELTKIAFIAADGIRNYNGDEAWGIESWVKCDPAELPADVTEDLEIGVWEDSAGARVPVTRIRSFQGAEHCDWQRRLVRSAQEPLPGTSSLPPISFT